MIFRLSTQKIVEKDRDRYQQQKKCLLVPPLSEAELAIMLGGGDNCEFLSLPA